MKSQVKHIGFFKFKAGTTQAEVDEVGRILESLMRDIPGILDLTYGANMSPEGLDQGYTFSFVMVFESVAARDTYLPHPIHQAAVVKVIPKLESVVVCDHTF